MFCLPFSELIEQLWAKRYNCSHVLCDKDPLPVCWVHHWSLDPSPPVLSACPSVYLSTYPPVYLSRPPVRCPVHLSTCPLPTCPWLPSLSMCHVVFPGAHPSGCGHVSRLWMTLCGSSVGLLSPYSVQMASDQPASQAPEDFFLRTHSVSTPRGNFCHFTPLLALLPNNCPRPTRAAAGSLQGGLLAFLLPAVQMSPASPEMPD